MRYLFAIAAALFAALTFVLFNMGMDYINFDHGLHPLIAFPSALVTVLLLWVSLSFYTYYPQMTKLQSAIEQLAYWD